MTQFTTLSTSESGTWPEIPKGTTKLEVLMNALETEMPLPGHLADSLTTLSVYNSSLTGISNLLGCTKLQELTLLDCSNLKKIGPLPASLQTLTASNLTELPDLSGCTHLKRVDLRACEKMPCMAWYVSQLEAMEERGVDVRWPKHWPFRTQALRHVQTQLTRITTAYIQQHPNARGAMSTVNQFLERFLIEELEQRGGADVVEQQVLPALNFLEKSPQHLPMVADIAEHYLQGCVNQPVAGWSDVVVWLRVAQAKGPIAQLEALRAVRVMADLTELVAKSQPHPGPGVEIEAGNALYREVHTKLLKEGAITKSWPAVPGPIAYEQTIKSWLTKEKTQAACDKVKLTLSCPLSEIGQWVCSGVHAERWGQLAFPQAVSALWAQNEWTAQRAALAAAAELFPILEQLAADEPLAAASVKNREVAVDTAISKLRQADGDVAVQFLRALLTKHPRGLNTEAYQTALVALELEQKETVGRVIADLTNRAVQAESGKTARAFLGQAKVRNDSSRSPHYSEWIPGGAQTPRQPLLPRARESRGMWV